MPTPFDIIDGTEGDDVLTGTVDNDTINGLGGNDTIDGGEGDDLLNGGLGSDTIEGGAGNDIIDGGPFQPNGNPAIVDRLSGGAGDDIFTSPRNGANDVNIIDVDGGSGIDKIDYSAALSGVSVYDSNQSGIHVASIEHIIGSPFGDTLTLGNGGVFTTVLEGGAGNDTLNGGEMTFGGDGNDTINGLGTVFGGAGDDTLNGGLTVFGDAGNDSINLGTNASGFGGDGDDTFLGAVNLAVGGVFLSADGGAGVDKIRLFLFGGSFDLTAGLVVSGGSTLSVANFENAENFGDGTWNVAGTDGANTLTFSGSERFGFATGAMQGQGGNDTLVGSNGNDTLNGDAGDDVLGGGAGADSLSGGAGADSLSGGDGADSLSGGDGDDFLQGGLGNDTLNGGAGFDTASFIEATGPIVADLNAATITGGSIGTDAISSIEGVIGSLFGDTLIGTSGANLLDGNEGADTMTGGDGDDIYVADASSDVIIESAGGGVDLVRTQVSRTLGAFLENLTLIGAASNGTGNELANVITGNGSNNVLSGLAGADTLSGGAGNDTLNGGVGADSMSGGLGDDVYSVDDAGDTTNEALGEGTDRVDASVNWTLALDLENLTLIGIAASGGGNGLANRLIGNASNNALSGLGGDDLLIGGVGADALDGGAGSDTVDYSSSGAGVIVSLLTGAGSGGDAQGDTLVSIENIIPSAFNDVLTGNGAANLLSGGVGDDTLTGGDGDDTLLAAAGADTLSGGAGADMLIGGAGADALDGGAGTDTVDYSSSGAGITVNLQTGLGAGGDAQGDTLATIENLIGSGFNDILTGTSAANVLSGGAGDDTIDGGAGADTMAGGLGNDTYFVDSAGDIATELAGQGADTLSTVFNWTLANEFENLTLIGIASTGTGNDGVNVILGNASNNILSGLAGADTIHGGAGDDTLDGGSGADSMFGGDGNDTYIVDQSFETITELAGEGIDTVQSSAGYALGPQVENLTLTGTGNINGSANGFVHNFIIGNGASNVLSGGDGNDTLRGGGGGDTLQGGAGNDTLRGGDGADTLDGGGSPFSDSDVADYSTSGAGVTINLDTGAASGGDAQGDTLIAIEGVIGTSFADTLIGSAFNGIFTGGAGDDILVGGRVLDGGAGDDDLDTGATGAQVDGGAGIDVVRLRHGGSSDHLTFVASLAASASGFFTMPLVFGGSIRNAERFFLETGLGNDTATFDNGLIGQNGWSAGLGDDRLIVDMSAATETVTLGHLDAITTSGFVGIGPAQGGPGNFLTQINFDNVEAFTISGGSGIDSLVGGDGADVFAGNGGGDTLNGAGGLDTAAYAGSNAGVSVNLATGVVAGGHAQGDTLTGIENLVGSAFADTLIGDAGANALEGGAGADALDGGGGVDTADYSGSDVGVSVDLASGVGAGGDAEGDTLTSIENLIGSAFDDTLSGDALVNLINGGDGIDTVSYAGSNTSMIVELYRGFAFGGEGAEFLISIENVIGSAFDDRLIGSFSVNILDGGAGADVLIGVGSGDTADYSASLAGVTVNLALGTGIGGDAAGDTLAEIYNLRGSGLADILTGNTAANTLIGGAGNDQLFGGAGADTLDGGDGVDMASYETALAGVTARLLTPASNSGDAAGDSYASIENLRGSALGDILGGDDSANTLWGEGGADTLEGQGGNDVLIGGVGADVLGGGAGIDTADYATSGAAVNVNLAAGSGLGGDAQGDSLFSIEIVTGSAFADTLSGRDFVTDTLNGGDGDDVLMGRYGGDVLNGGNGRDTISYVTSLTGVDVRLFNGLAIGGEANGDVYTSIENIIGSATRTDTLAGDDNANSIWGGGGNETIAGRDGSDHLYGEAGNDTLLGGAADDFLIGGAGADTLGGGVGNDTADYSASAAGVTVNLATGLGSGGDAQGDGLVSIENVIGSAFNDVIVGKANTTNNVFDGGAGDDVMTGGLGNDTFVFRAGSGADTVTDFSPLAASNNDAVQLAGFGAGFDSFAEVIAGASQVGAHTVIDFGSGQTLTLQNTTLASLTSNDFIFG